MVPVHGLCLCIQVYYFQLFQVGVALFVQVSSLDTFLASGLNSFEARPLQSVCCLFSSAKQTTDGASQATSLSNVGDSSDDHEDLLADDGDDIGGHAGLRIASGVDEIGTDETDVEAVSVDMLPVKTKKRKGAKNVLRVTWTKEEIDEVKKYLRAKSM